MKKTTSIIALFMFTSMSGLSLADKNEGVKIKFKGDQDNKAAKQQEENKLLGGKKLEEQSGEQTNKLGRPMEHDH